MIRISLAVENDVRCIVPHDQVVDPVIVRVLAMIREQVQILIGVFEIVDCWLRVADMPRPRKVFQRSRINIICDHDHGAAQCPQTRNKKVSITKHVYSPELDPSSYLKAAGERQT